MGAEALAELALSMDEGMMLLCVGVGNECREAEPAADVEPFDAKYLDVDCLGVIEWTGEEEGGTSIESGDWGVEGCDRGRALVCPFCIISLDFAAFDLALRASRANCIPEQRVSSNKGSAGRITHAAPPLGLCRG